MNRNDPGIYAIVNNINHKMYVGSAVNCRKRFKHHRGYLNNGKHFNTHLQRAWNKYGSMHFTFVILEFVEEKKDLLEREDYWIKRLKCCNPQFGYNKRTEASSNFGIVASDETRIKIGNVHRGKTVSEETKKKLSKINIGKKHTEASKAKMSLSQKGLIKHTNESRAFETNKSWS